MLDHTAAALACTSRLLTLSVVSTGAIDMSATATGYARAVGSFVTDGLARGMEITPAGFGSNPIDTIADVSALALRTTNPRPAEASAAGRSISVLLPAIQAWENIQAVPVANRWSIEESYLPGPSEQIGLGARARIDVFPTYIVTLNGLANTGKTALYRAADAVLALFPPRYAMTLSTGDVLRVRTNPAPYRGQLIPLAAGRAAIVVTIPLRAETANSI